MDEDLNRQSVTPADAELVCGLALEGDRTSYLTGQDLCRARRMVEFGLLEQRHLGDRYFGVTTAGRSFARTVQEHRSG